MKFIMQFIFDMLTRQNISIVLTIIGTFLIAYSVRSKRQYKGKLAKVVDKIKKENPDYIEPTETHINNKMIYFGLGLIVIGAALQISLVLNCSNPDKFSTALVRTMAKGEGTIIDFRKLTVFEWDNVHIYGPYSPYEKIDKKLGTSFNSNDYDNHVKEGECLFIFMLNGHPEYISTTKRHIIGCSEIVKAEVYAPTDAIFIVKGTSTGPTLIRQ